MTGDIPRAAMSPDEVKARKAELDQQRRDLAIAMDDLEDEYRRLRRRCSHPNAYATTVMGDDTTKCPDCGWAQ